MSSNPLCGKNSVHWLKVERPSGSGLSTVVNPKWWLSKWLAWSHDHVSLSGCVTLAAWNVTGRLTCPTPRQSCVTLTAWHVTCRLTCLADSLAQHHFSTPRCSTPARYWREICREACLVRAPNYRSGGCEFESPMRQELGALTKTGKTLGVRSFYSVTRWIF